MTSRRRMIYTRFERFWHWGQAALIGLLLLTGFELHGSLSLWGFRGAYLLHVCAGAALLVLTAFAVFWHLTTGAWRHYVPVREGLARICRFYLVGIFRGEPHPFERRPDQKLNPLQRLAYLLLKLLLYPGQLLTGVLLLVQPWCALLGRAYPLEGPAFWHLVGTYAFLAFLIVHIYLTTTGRPWYAHLRSMVLGWE